jgi:hypothetical protein
LRKRRLTKGDRMRRSMLGILLTAFLAACSDTPTVGAGEEAFEQHVQRVSQGVQIQIVDFQKTNGQSFERDGIKGYHLFYRATVAFPAGYRPECVQRGSSFAGFDCFLGFAGKAGLKPVPAGASVAFAGTIDFERTENGWIAKGIDVAETTVSVPDPSDSRFDSSSPIILAQGQGGGEGGFWTFETLNALDRKRAVSLVARWPPALESAGASTYQIVYLKPSLVRLCVWNSVDPERLRAAVLHGTNPPSDLRLIEERAFRGNCPTALEAG